MNERVEQNRKKRKMDAISLESEIKDDAHDDTEADDAQNDPENHNVATATGVVADGFGAGFRRSLGPGARVRRWWHFERQGRSFTNGQRFGVAVFLVDHQRP